MNRWIVLAAAPWAIATSTFTYQTMGGEGGVPGIAISATYKGKPSFISACIAPAERIEEKCGNSREVMEDFVVLMNQVHERRFAFTDGR